MSNTILFKRGIKSSLDTLAGGNNLAAGQPYLVTDEGRLYVGTNPNSYIGLANLTDLPDEIDTPWLVTDIGTGTSQDITLPESVAVDQVLVFVHGLHQRPTTDYTISGLTLTITAPVGDPISIFKNTGGVSLVQGWTGGIDGLTADAEIINLGFANKSVVVSESNTKIWALTGATAETIMTLYKKSSVGATPVSVLTATFSAGGESGPQAAIIDVTNTIEAGSLIYWRMPDIADITLANINYLISDEV